MRVAFRVDASEEIGTGHVMRCLALADALKSRGVDTRFIMATAPGNLEGVVCERGFQVLAIDAYGSDEGVDGELTASMLAAQEYDWLVVDHYQLGRSWEETVRRCVPRILAIDDLRRSHYCKLLLDQGCFGEQSEPYRGKVPETTELLLGPRYALLHPGFGTHARTQQDQVRRIFVFFGGSDPDDLTGLAVEAFSRPGLEDLQLEVVLGRNSPHGTAVQARASRRGRARVHGFQRSLAPLMAGCELAVGAGGVTLLERLAVGLPALVISVAANQASGCEAAAGLKLIEYLGPKDAVDVALLARRATALRYDPPRLAFMSAGGKRLVDGYGTARVVERMLA